MNVEKFKNEFTLLSQSPWVFSGKQFDREYKKLFGKNKSAAREYASWLNRQFEFMKTRSVEELVLLPSFEDIIHTDDGIIIYSLRRANTPGNPRILFSFIARENEPIYFFLLAFNEKNTADYERNIPIACERMRLAIALLNGGK